jgi:hypothetical protein
LRSSSVVHRSIAIWTAPDIPPCIWMAKAEYRTGSFFVGALVGCARAGTAIATTANATQATVRVILSIETPR